MKYKRFKTNFKTGQSMIEVVVALGVVILLAVSLVSTTLVTQRTARSAKNNTQATKLVQQNIEQMRIFRDRKGFDYLTDGSCFTLTTTNPDPVNWSLSTANCPDGEQIPLDKTNFRRKIAISAASANKKSVAVTVSWEETGGAQQVVNQTYLSKTCQGAVSSCP